MAEESSYGIIAFRKQESQWQVLLVLHNQGHWSFPKGRIEAGEDPKQCAIREFREETGLKISRFLSDLSFVEHYELYRDSVLTHKTVTYFVAAASGIPQPQEEEVSECRWVFVGAAEQLITHQAARQVFNDVLARVSL